MSAGTSLCPRSSYNTGGMVLTKTDSRGKTSTYTYDVRGRIVQVSEPRGHTISHDLGA